MKAKDTVLNVALSYPSSRIRVFVTSDGRRGKGRGVVPERPRDPGAAPIPRDYTPARPSWIRARTKSPSRIGKRISFPWRLISSPWARTACGRIPFRSPSSGFPSRIPSWALPSRSRCAARIPPGRPRRRLQPVLPASGRSRLEVPGPGFHGRRILRNVARPGQIRRA